MMGFGWFPSFIYQAGGPLEPMREGSLRPLLVPLDYFYKDILTPWVLAILLYIFARAYYFLREASFSSLCIVLFLQASSLRPFLQASSLRPFSEASTLRPFWIASTWETLFGGVYFGDPFWEVSTL